MVHRNEGSKKSKCSPCADSPQPADGQRFLLLWKWVNLSEGTSFLTRMEGKKITYDLDSTDGDLEFFTDFFCEQIIFLPQLSNGNNLRLVCDWMDVSDYGHSYVVATGMAQGHGLNSLSNRWICWDIKVCLEFSGSCSAYSSLVIIFGDSRLSLLPDFRTSAGLTGRWYHVKLFCREEHEKKTRIHSNSVSFQLYLCFSGSTEKSPHFYSLDPVSAALSSISCSTLGS